MLKKTITYTDFNGEEVKEDFLFHLSKAELVELEASHDEGLSVAMQKIVDTEDTKAIVAEFKRLILLAYGKKSMDGRRFIKNQTMRDEFESSEAYSTLFMELVTNSDAAVEFMNGILPTGLVPENAEVVPIRQEPRRITMAEVKEMSAQEYKTLSEKIVSGEVEIIDETLA